MLLGFLWQQAIAVERKSPAEVSPHVLFVNVGKVMNSKQFEAAVSNACAQVQIKWRSECVPKITMNEIIISKEEQSKKWGREAVLVVYLTDDQALPGLLNLPGQCSLINIRTMHTDSPSVEVYESRMKKSLMKGLAYAAGVGSNCDPHCVMYWKSFSASGIDGTSSTFGPYAFFALQDILGALAGGAIFQTEQ